MDCKAAQKIINDAQAQLQQQISQKDFQIQ